MDGVILHGIRGIFLIMEAMKALDLLQIMDDEEFRPMHHGCNIEKVAYDRAARNRGLSWDSSKGSIMKDRSEIYMTYLIFYYIHVTFTKAQSSLNSGKCFCKRLIAQFLPMNLTSGSLAPSVKV